MVSISAKNTLAAPDRDTHRLDAHVVAVEDVGDELVGERPRGLDAPEGEGDGRALGQAHRDAQLAPRVLGLVQDDLGVGVGQVHLDGGDGHDPPLLGGEVEHLERRGRQRRWATVGGPTAVGGTSRRAPGSGVGHRWARSCTESAMPMAEKKATVAEPP